MGAPYAGGIRPRARRSLRAHHDVCRRPRRRQPQLRALRNTHLWSETPTYPEFLLLRPGSLDDTSWLQPVAHVWTRSAQPWFRFAPGATTYDTQPADLTELAALWQSRRRT